MEKKAAKTTLQNNWFAVAPGVWGMKDMFVNFYMIQDATAGKWALIDAGLKTSAPKIRKMANDLFWPNSRPAAIILTHGHFDHIGSVKTLAQEWDVPVYAHALEQPYLTGKSSYPPPDPMAGGGLVTSFSWLFPKGPSDISDYLYSLPADGTIPGLQEWKYIHTPGHAPGHISLYREADGVLLAGDAFVTTRLESAISSLTQRRQLSGPPRYFTPDWKAAGRSVALLASLRPEVVATGHGLPMRGRAMRQLLYNLAANFNELAVPKHGRYTNDAAITSENGVLYVPPAKVPVAAIIAGMSVAALAAGYLVYRRRKLSRFA
jgi:glyoxylase-like metal-dependent hydrolase (beta-lactamase superfamily II)